MKRQSILPMPNLSRFLSIAHVGYIAPILCIVLSACSDDPCILGFKKDFDEDTYVDPKCGGDDCDDTRADVHPGATELCDANQNNPIDHDCNPETKEPTTTLYFDTDEDGHASIVGQEGCPTEVSVAKAGDDCNDSNEAIHPGATEDCNTIDDNCDGLIDEGATVSYYLDADSDGFGATSVAIAACEDPPPVGYVLNDSDCDDTSENVHPDASEECDGIDNNCNLEVDEGFDTDRDGVSICQGDCDDKDAQNHPDNKEICDSHDNNCDGNIDEGVQDTFYLDNDGDGYGLPLEFMFACLSQQPENYALEPGDCADDNPDINPSVSEVCDDLDNNCDDEIDEGLSTFTWYEDADEDGYGTPLVKLSSCFQPAGYSSKAGDCNDRDTDVFPTATELCNGIDDNCEGLRDEGCVLSFTGLLDQDLDGFGIPCVEGNERACQASQEPPAGTGLVSWRGDCDDTDPSTHPGADDPSGGTDQDCGGSLGPEPSVGLGGSIESIQQALNQLTSSKARTLWVGALENGGWAAEDLTFPSAYITLKAVKVGTVLQGAGTPDTHSHVIKLTSNTAFLTVDGFTLTGGYGDLGGAVYMTNGSLTLRNVLITGNTAQDGGGVGISSGAELTLEDSVVTENVAHSDGGGIHCQGGSLTLKTSEVSSNTALNGGGIAVAGGVLEMTETTLTQNHAGTDTDAQILGNGGGLFVDYGEVNLTGGTIGENSAEFAGGGVFLRWNVPDNYETTRDDGSCSCQNNDKNNVPNEPEDFDWYGDPNHLEGVNIQGNTAMVGGGVYLRKSNPTIQNCIIQDNVAEGYNADAANTTCESNSSTYIGGGGIALYSATVNLVDTDVLENRAHRGGGLLSMYNGGVYCAPRISIEHSTFRGNETLSLDPSAQTLCSGQVCTYDLHGGAVFAGHALELKVSNSVIEDNDSASQIGGIALSNSNSIFDHVVVRRNKSLAGGANGITMSGNQHTLSHVRVTDQSSGGLLSGSGAFVTLEHSVVTNNSTHGIYLYRGQVSIRDSIIAYNGHTASTHGSESANIYAVEVCDGEAEPKPEIDVHDSDLYYSYGNTAHGVYLICLVNGIYQTGLLNVSDIGTFLSIEPQFQSYFDAKTKKACLPGSSLTCLPDDLHLALTSPLVNAGDPESFDVDGSRADMGLYGGPDGDAWDMDGDGALDYFWPGAWSDAPVGFLSGQYDCDDLDEAVQSCTDL